MRDMLWIYAAIILLLPKACHVSGTNQTISANSDTSSSPKLYVVRNEAFNVGSDVNLTCSNKTWNEMMYVIWTIEMKYNPKECKIAFDTEGRSDDSCEDGKSLRNTSSAQSYLHIPNFSDYDVGVYKCESVYRGANENYKIHVAITVPPSISAWLERKDNRMVAVCKAESGIPAANISWSHMGNSSTVKTSNDSRGFYTVESLLELPEGMDTVNLSCVIRHPYWKGEKILVPELQKGYVLWLCVLIVVVIIVFLAGVLFFAQKKIIMLRQCQQSDDTSSPSKSPPIEDVEEVEPYASYIQRVNSIYNSSDLYT